MLAADVAQVILSEDQIARRVRELGQEISKDYDGEDLVLVCVLRGAVVFLADLLRAISIPLTIDFVAVSSYGASTESSGVVRIAKDIEVDVEDKHVLIVEDIVDTGWTLRMSYLTEDLRAKKARSVRVCSLLDKPSRRKVDVGLDYVGFVVPDKFVVGYGLDFKGLYRNLPFIGVLKEEMYLEE